MCSMHHEIVVSGFGGARLVYQVAREGFLDQHIRTLRTLYRTRRDAMLDSMHEHFPRAVQWTRPEGGLFLWVSLPEGMDTTELLQSALEERVAFVPGASFHANGGGANTLRLNVSNATPQQIHERIARLGRVLETQSDRVIPTQVE